jgi:hypothetical protein
LQKPQISDAKQYVPTITWSQPPPIAYGKALDATVLNAMASVPGSFAYTPAAGEVLRAGPHTLSVTFTPADAIGHAVSRAVVSLTVNKATPALRWPKPASISYGTALSATQLNATASVPGSLVYTPAAGEILTSGVQILFATFIPMDTTNYTLAQATVSLLVTRAEPTIQWPKPAMMSYGTALSAAQLNATASVPGSFVYTPAVGEVLRAGVHSLLATFTPTDGTDYAPAQATVSLTITKAKPIITWPKPAALTQGAALGSAQLNATASVPGSFVYTPAAGEVLASGTHTLLATFTPTEATGYDVQQAVVSLTVNKATPVVTRSKPAVSIVQGNAPAATQLKPEPEPRPIKVAPAVAQRPSAKTQPAPQKPLAKLHAKPSVKVAQNPPAKSQAKSPAKPRGKASAKNLVKAPAPKSAFNVGPGLDVMGSAVFQDGTTIYMVMQPGSAGLTSSNRLVSKFFTTGGPKPEVVINRFGHHSQGVAEGKNSTALTKPASLPISRLIGQVVRLAFASSSTSEEKTEFSLKALGRSLWAKIFNPVKPPSMTQLGLAAGQSNADVLPRAIVRRSIAKISRKSVDAPSVTALLGVKTKTPPNARAAQRIPVTADQFRAELQSASAKAARAQANKPASDTRPGAKKIPVKAPPKRLVTAAQNPTAKTPAKSQAKAAKKLPAKTPAK